MSPQDKGRRGGGRGQGQSRDVQVSKALSLLLRHAAEKEGVKMNAQGYANVAEVVSPHFETLISRHSPPLFGATRANQ